MIDAEMIVTLDLAGLLSHLAACRAADDAQGFWFTIGASVLALRPAGYRHVYDATPIAPDDRWRLALWAELEAAAAQWPEPVLPTVMRQWLLHFVPPD